MNCSSIAHFPGARAILFDAVGTLIHPHPSAAEVYAAAGRTFGMAASPEQVAGRFRLALQRHTQDYEQPTSEAHERQRWRKIVAEVLPLEGIRGEELFEFLWAHFADSRCWAPYADAEDAWRSLQDRGLVLGVASNFDRRLLGICRDIPWLADCPNIFCSSQVGFCKPNRRFFDTIQTSLGLPPERLVYVGDDPESDFVAARSAGWQAIWLDRQQSHRPALFGPPQSMQPDIKIRGLGELAELFWSR